MDIQTLKSLIDPVINNMLHEIESQDISYNISILKKVINESITEYKTGLISQASNAHSMFTGRGRAWAKVNEDQPLFTVILKKLQQNKNSEINTTDLIDLFEQNRFAWMRFSRANKNFMVFHLRYKGSKFEDCIPFKVEYNDIFQIENLEGVPHNIGLEEGNFTVEINTKQKVEEELVDTEELNNFGIKTLEDILAEV